MITVRKYRNGGKKDFQIQKSRANLYFVWEGAKCLRENLSTMEEAEHQINQIILNRKKSALEQVSVLKTDGTTYVKSLKPMKKSVEKCCVECGGTFIDETVQQLKKICSDECREKRGQAKAKDYAKKYAEKQKLKIQEAKTTLSMTATVEKEKNADAVRQKEDWENDRLQREGFAKGVTEAHEKIAEETRYRTVPASELFADEDMYKAMAEAIQKKWDGKIKDEDVFTHIFESLISVNPEYKKVIESSQYQESINNFISTISKGAQDFGQKLSGSFENAQSKLKTKPTTSVAEKLKVEIWEQKALKSEVESYASMFACILEKLWEEPKETVEDLLMKMSNLSPYGFKELNSIYRHYGNMYRLDKWDELENFLSEDLFAEREFVPSTEQKSQLRGILKDVESNDGFNLKSYVFDHFVDVKDKLKISNENVCEIKNQVSKLVTMIGRSDDTVNQLGHVINKNEESIQSLSELTSTLIKAWAQSESTLETKIEHLATKIESLESRIESLVGTLHSLTSTLENNKKKGWFNK